MKFARHFGLVVLLFFPAVVLGAPNTFEELAYDVAEMIDMATFTLIVFGLVMYFWGIVVNIPHFGDEKGAEKQKSFFFWGLIVLFVMVSIWGIVKLLQNSLFGNSPFDPATGDSRVTLCDSFGNCQNGE